MSYDFTSVDGARLYSSVVLNYCMRRWDYRPGLWTVSRFIGGLPGDAEAYALWHAVMDDFGNLVRVEPR